MDIRKGTRGAAKQDGSRGWDWRGGGKIDFDFGFDFGMDPGGDANTWILYRIRNMDLAQMHSRGFSIMDFVDNIGLEPWILHKCLVVTL